jgi:hypothetical protein
MRLCPKCVKEFEPTFTRQKFCSKECSTNYFTKIKNLFGSYRKFKYWLDTNLITTKDFNEFKI